MRCPQGRILSNSMRSFTSSTASPNFNISVPFAPGWSLTEHGVNHAMALKEGAVRWRAGGGDAAAALSHLKVDMLDSAHGQPIGTFSADECLAGREPNRGVELCTIVDTAASLRLLHRTHGDVSFADRAGALPCAGRNCVCQSLTHCRRTLPCRAHRPQRAARRSERGCLEPQLLVGHE